MTQLHDIVDIASQYLSGEDLELIKKAYVFAAQAHQGQTRRSGEPYMIHPTEVAKILAEMRMDAASVATGFLHDTVEDTVATLEEIEAEFGAEVRSLVDGVTKLGQIRFRTREEKQAENFRKMIMAMAQDIRVILIKLADRLHNMGTLEFLRPDRQEGIAQETMDIYAPIANRLGMQQMKIELEDLAFRYLKPEAFETINARIEERRESRDKFVAEVRTIVGEKLRAANLPEDIQGRLKHLYSIHRKMERQNIPFSEVHDLVAFRLLVDSVPQCYEALGLLHALWKPVPGRFKDYVAMPKQNNYQSLHTTVVGPHGMRCEFQIRTKSMHDVAERGIAAHWRYKESGSKLADSDEMKFKWVRQLLEWQRELDEPVEFLDTIKLDLFADDIYIFTPNGDLRELPRGSTPVDFAYDVHTDVGNSCVGAKVNGCIVPLRQPLRSGDTVEVLTGKQQRPNKDWLQFVKTSRAKAKIRLFLRQEERVQAEGIGRELFEKAASKYGLTANRILKSDEMARYLRDNNMREVSSLMATIGYGKLAPLDVLTEVVPKDKLQLADEKTPKAGNAISRFVGKLRRTQRSPVRISGISDILVSFGKCCNPVPGDSIVGFVTRGRGVSVHTSSCSKVLASDPARCIPVEWDTGAGVSRVARIRVVCVNRPGLLANMTEAITNKKVNIAGLTSRTMDGDRAVSTFDVEIQDLDQLREVLRALEKIKGVVAVERVKG